MAIRGIEPSYFAGMPTTRLDPNAGQVGESYAAMPGQALTEVANRNERRSEVDQNNAFRARDQAHREQQDAQSGARDDRRLAMYQQGEDRRQTQQGFENDRLKSADTMRLVQAMQAAVNDGEHGIAEAIAAELKGRGWGAKPLGAQGGAAPAQPMQQDAPGGTAPQRAPMSRADAQTSAELDQAERSIIPKLRGTGPTAPATSPPVSTPSPTPAPKRPGNQDPALSGQLDQIEKQYMGGLGAGATPMPYEQAMAAANRAGALGVKQVPGGWTPIVPGDDNDPPYQAQPRSLVPGRAMRPQVAQSNAMLSPDDPLNRIVQ